MPPKQALQPYFPSLSFQAFFYYLSPPLPFSLYRYYWVQASTKAYSIFYESGQTTESGTSTPEQASSRVPQSDSIASNPLISSCSQTTILIGTQSSLMAQSSSQLEEQTKSCLLKLATRMLQAFKFLKAIAPQEMSSYITLVFTIFASQIYHSALSPITIIVSINTNSCLILPTIILHCSVEPSISTSYYPSTKYIFWRLRVQGQMGSATFILRVSMGLRYCMVELRVNRHMGLTPMPKAGSTSIFINLALNLFYEPAQKWIQVNLLKKSTPIALCFIFQSGCVTNFTSIMPDQNLFSQTLFIESYSSLQMMKTLSQP